MPATTRPTLFCLHFLGGSARLWSSLASELAPVVDCRPLDLPGFGAAANLPGAPVADMATVILSAISAAAPASWLLAGHSMGAKVAAAIARRVEDAATPPGLAGLILIAGSPPAPEPMSEDRRAAMLGWFAGPPEVGRQQARDYIGANTAAPLDPATHAAAAAEVLGANPGAWRAWLGSGSREDWRSRIGILQTPTLILAGADDEDLGPEAQRTLMSPHFARAELVTIPAAKHLLPLEQPELLARVIARWLAAIERPPPAAHSSSPAD